MKAHRFSLIFALAACALSGAQHVAAQRIDSPYRFLDHSQYLGLYAGHVWAQEGQLQMGPQPGPTFGARWGIRLSGPFSIGADVGLTPTTRTVRDTTFLLPDSVYRAVGESDVLLVSIMGEGRFSLTGARTWYRLHPFLTAGAGVVFDVAGTPAVEQDVPPSERYNFGTSFAGHLGAGVEWFATNRVSVRVDGRGLFWRLTAPETLTQRRAIPRSEWENNGVVTAGLSYHF
jgi:opacity protein-like surface antigen